MSLKSGKSATSSRASSDSSYLEPEFVLKHRIVGAAFLLFFGALFLPWVLGAPSDEKQASVTTQSTDGQIANRFVADGTSRAAPDEEGSTASVDELAAAIAGEQVETEEQVYISKITPLDGADADPSEPRTSTQSSGNTSAAESVAKEKPVSREAKQQAGPRVDQSTANSVNSSNPEQKAQTKSASDTKIAESPESGSTLASAEKTATPETVKPATIEVGWIVQVGVFTDKRGAGKVVDDLRNKGFQPSTTIVDTNRGPASGTRIWLGPFSQRVNAAKAKAELTDKTGEAGFIRAYP